MACSKCLIDLDGSGKLHANEEGLNLIRNIPADYEIVPITGVGPGRIGKSTLLNQLHGEDVFEVGSTMNRVTKGIHVAMKLDHTTKRAVLYIDVEGFGDPKRATGSDDGLLLTVCQLCDVLIYNFRGVFDYEMMEKVRMVCYVFERYRGKNQVLSKPVLIVSLRDFDLDFPDSPDGELQELVQQTSINLAGTFRQQKAFLFVKPTERKKLRDMQTMSDKDLDPDFVTTRTELQDYLKKEAKPLCALGSKNITGEVYAETIVKTVQAINDDNLGNITKTLPETLKEQNQNRKEEAVSRYKSQMQTLWPSYSAPEPVHSQCQTSNRIALHDKLFDIDGCTASILHDYDAQTKQYFQDLSKKKSEQELEKLSSRMESKYRNEQYHEIGGSVVFESDMQDLENKYKELKNLGPEADGVWIRYKLKQESKKRMIKDKERIIEDQQKAEKERRRLEDEENRIALMEQCAEREREELNAELMRM